MIPSKFQAAIFEFVQHGRGSAVIEAVAGSGKTTTIVKALELIPTSNQVAFLAFNKSIATELKSRVPAHVEAMTLNSLGHRALIKQLGRFIKLDANKTRAIAKASLTQDEQVNLPAIGKLVSLAKAHGLVPTEVRRATGLVPDTVEHWLNLIDHYDIDIEDDREAELVVSAARRVLALSMSHTDIIDFDDQLYMTVVLNLPVRRYDWLFVDEAQDVSPIQRALIRKALKPGGRLIAVGDSWQSIYGFRGADSDSMENIAREFGCTRLPLSISYRCPKNIVTYAQKTMPSIEPSDAAADGDVLCWAGYSANDFAPTDLIVCRNTKPLVGMAYALIARMVPCRVMGREIGQGLISLIERLRPRGIHGEKGLIEKLDKWCTKEIDKHLARGNDAKAEAAQDKADTIMTFIENALAETVPQLITAIQAMFSNDTNQQTLTLSTVHRAKGLEAPRVFVLDPELMPSRFARQAWQQRQEQNLIYVAVTRAKETLMFIRSGDLFANETAAKVNAAANGGR